MRFDGEISGRMQGFYRNKYTTPDGSETRYGASTQFEVCRNRSLLIEVNDSINSIISLQTVDVHFHVGMNQILKPLLISR